MNHCIDSLPVSKPGLKNQVLFFKNEIILSGIPLPPSANEQLMTARPNGKRFTRMIKTLKARAFDDDLRLWMLKNKDQIFQIRQHAKAMVSDETKTYLRVDCYFAFQNDRLFSKTKRAKDFVKRLDANNRLKSSLDALSHILNIDDRYFWTGLCEKVSCDSAQDEQIIMKVSAWTAKTINQVTTQDS